MKEINCKLLIIGAGPAGYVCAIKAGQLGIDTVIVESAKPGGTCLNIGCIPSKAMIHAAEAFHSARQMADGSMFGIRVQQPTIDLAATMEWKNGIVSRLNNGVSALLQKARVKTLTGTAKFRDGKTVLVETETGTQTVRAENIVIATGSVPVELPSLPFGGSVLSSADALSLQEVPRRLAVVGGGYIGLELGTAFAKFGAEVTILEAADQILPQYDADLVKPLSKRLAQLNVTVLTGTLAQKLDGSDLLIRRGNAEQTLNVDKVLVTVGRKPRTEGFGLEELGLDMAGPFIRVDERCRTSMRGVYAIGDVTGEPMLAHRASAQGDMVATIISAGKNFWDKRCIPAICYTDPEIVSVGMSLSEAQAQGPGIVTGQFPFSANGRAMTMQDDSGFVRVIAREDNRLVLGIQAVGAGVAELSSAFALAIEMGARLEDIASTIHAHPTRGEAFQEAAFKALGHGLHG